jgi:hypothetical protein
VLMATSCERVSNYRISLLHSSTNVSSLCNIYATFVAPLPDGKPTLCTFVFWNALGHKFAQLAAGGSIYVLLMVAGLDLYCNIARALGCVPFEVGKMLRRPDNVFLDS